MTRTTGGQLRLSGFCAVWYVGNYKCPGSGNCLTKQPLSIELKQLPRRSSTVLVIGDSTVAHCYDEQGAIKKETLEGQVSNLTSDELVIIVAV